MLDMTCGHTTECLLLMDLAHSQVETKDYAQGITDFARFASLDNANKAVCTQW
jgi:hypothetical protein